MKNKLTVLFASLLMLASVAATGQMKKFIKNMAPVGGHGSAVVHTAPNNPLSCSVDTILLTTQAQINNFTTNYPTCTTPKYLIIDGAGASPAITSLAGLSSITQVIFKLEIRNTSITSLSQMTGLTQVGDTLLLERNNSLTSIGLNNLTALGAIYFSHLPALTSVAGLCNNFHTTGLVYIDSTNLSNLTGLHTLDTLTTSNGGLFISNSPIINLSAMNNLKKMEGYLRMSNNNLQTSIGLTNIKGFWGFLLDGLPLLNSVGGLTNNLTNGNIGTFWFFNTGIASLAGLEGMTGAANFYINGNNNLTSLNGIQNLSGSLYGFSVWGNAALNNISALSGITNINDGTIEIAYNNNLTSLNGIHNITNIDKGLWIYGNGNLTTLNELNNNLVIQNLPDSYSGDRDSVRIFENAQLEVCADTSICNYLSGGGTAEIYNNAPGCNTLAEIQSSCGPGINYNDPEDNCCTYNAIPVNQNIARNGNVGHYIGVDGNGDPVYDEYDTYRIIMPYDGAFKLFFTAKNDSSCHEGASPVLSAEILDEYGNYLQYENLFNWNNADPCNMFKTDSFKFRGYANDTFYIRLNGDKISYNFYWQALDSTNGEPEPNDNIATAAFIAPLQIKKGHLKFKTPNHIDQNDYYKTVLPVSANIDVYLKITNRENTTPSSLNRLHFAWGYTAPVGYFSNSNYVALPNADEIIYDTIQICGLANDTIYFRLTAPQEAYEYEWSYKIKDTLPNDAFEPNNTLSTATSIVSGQTRQSAIGYIGKTSRDGEDNFVTVIPQSGTMKIYVQATTGKCDLGYLHLAGLNKQQNYVFTKYITGAAGEPGLPSALQTIVYDSVTLCGQPADTFYFKLTASADYSYQLWYNMTDTIPNVPEGTEPNNTFTTATPVNELDSVTARLRFITAPSIDDNDYFRVVLPKDGTMKLFVKGTNYNCNTSWINFWLYDRRQGAGQILFKQLPPGTNLLNGQTVYDTITICGLAADTFYLRFNSFGKFIYSFKYQLIDTSTNDTEPNGSFAAAITHTENELKKGHIQYFANGGYDNYDYYKTVLPKDGTLKLVIQATNRSCANGQWFYLRSYDGAFNQLSAQYLANNGSVAAGQTIYDTIYLCGRAVDTFYLRFEASAAFTYQYTYQLTDTSANDTEPNNSFAQTTSIAENEIKKGHIRYNSNGGTDNYDYYKTVLPKDGTIKLIVQATNNSCANGQWFYVRSYDGTFSQLYAQYLANNGSVAAGQTVYDTIYLCGRAVDTFYLRFEASNAFSYQWKYQMIDTGANDIEPNNSFAEATAVGSNQIKKGHIRYNANGGTDSYDYYRFIFNTSDSLKIQMQATNRSCANGQWLYLRSYNKNLNQLFAYYFANNGSVAAGQTVYDSIKMYVTAPDTIYLRYEASNAFSYQLSTNERLPSAPVLIGDSTTCFGVKTYKAINVIDDNVVYHWSLSGGGTLNFTDSIATVNWNANGTHIVSLYLSNNVGNSPTVTRTVIVNNNPPTEVPLLQNFARTLSTSGLPSGAVCKWYKNGVEIAGITDSVYYAADSGTYTVRFVRPCGTGPVSNSFYFPLPAQAQTISFTHTPNITMSPTAKAKLNATASSSLPVVFQLVSGNAAVVGDTVYVTSVGAVIVKAIQAGSDVYAAAIPKYDTITVVQGPQTITFNNPGSQVYSNTPLTLTAVASSGLGVGYTIVSGNATISGSNLIMTGAGNVTVQANQAGNANYSAAPPVQQTFCIGVRSLSAISGSISPCLNNYVYTTDKIPGANYVWTLSSGGAITTNNDTAFINWTTAGTHTITVKANSACDAVYSNIVSLTITTNNNAPAPVTNMVPADNAQNQQLPLTLSWIPGSNSVNYDVYIWDSAQVQPGIPFAANINGISYTIAQNALQYNKTYKWRVVSKNPCLTTSGPIQHFRLIPLPDLQVLNVQAPISAFSGQTVTFNWTVKNNGPGKTQSGMGWTDAVFLSFDSIPNFAISPQTNPGAWSQLVFPLRPLLVGTKNNISALDSGQSYNNSINFTLPVNYSQPLYIYVITNYPANGNLVQTTVANDTARAPQPINVTLSPTPDLRVDTVFVPATTFSGSTITVTYKVKNYGVLTPAGTSWYDKFYISPTANFNIGNASELFLPKANARYYDCNGNYYSGEPYTTQLLQDSSYTKAVTLTLPNFIYGTYFIHVVTNKTASLYEGALINNNTNSKQLQVYLTPTPVLDVNTLNVPYTNASITQPLSISWNINNGGFHDNIQRNQGRHAKQGAFCGTYQIGYTPPPNSQPIYAAGYLYTDSLGWGNSYWNEKIYLSRDSGNIATANLVFVGKYNHGSETNPIVCNDYSNTCLIGGNQDRNIDNVIRPLNNYPGTFTFNVPDTLSEGNYYIYVLANADKTVYEYPATNRYKISGRITISKPDVIVSKVSLPAAITADTAINITYTIKNIGTGGVFNHIRKDNIYTSTSPVFNASAQLVSVQTFTESIVAGDSVQHTIQYSFPAATSGTRYIFVHTNFDSAFKETNSTNNRNVSNATVVSPPATADMVVTSFITADTLTGSYNNNFTYTVQNNGVRATTHNFYDSLFISCNPVFNNTTAYYIGRKQHVGVIAPGNSYTETISLYLPFGYDVNNCFPVMDYNNAYFFIKTNADTAVYEGSNYANNYTGSGGKKLFNPFVDHIVSAVTSNKDTFTVGANTTLNWTVKNNGYLPGNSGYYNYWHDAIYLSPDSVLNGNAVSVTSYGEDRRINHNQTYSTSRNFILPVFSTGDYYVHVKTNASAIISGEKVLINNANIIRNGAGAAKKIHVVLPILADLTDSIIAAPASSATGQPFKVVYKATNTGAGTWNNISDDEVWLSQDFVTGNTGDIFLGSIYKNRTVPPGQSFTDSVAANIPLNTAPGNYLIIVKVNRSLYPEASLTNNTAYRYTSLYIQPPSDLIVQSVTKPDTVLLGYNADTIRYVVQNIAANTASGNTTDGIYLSPNNTYDSLATLILLNSKTLNLSPLAKDTNKITPFIGEITEGNYYVIARADVQGNINESNKSNNTGISSSPLYVRVKQLPLNVLYPDSLRAVNNYFKLIIPDSLNGATIQVTLKSNDSLTKYNQMFIGKGYIPNAGHFDYAYGTPNYGNQTIVMDAAISGTYYVSLRCSNPGITKQTITLKAVKLPFTILNVHTNSGGNTGNVTVKISGSLYVPGMAAKLERAGDTITASAIYYASSTTVYATFNLAGKLPNIYSVSLTKADASRAVLTNGFSIVNANNGGLITGGGINGIPGDGNSPGCDPNAQSGLNAQLVSEIVAPEKVLGGWVFVVQINYNNPTNVDIPAQTRVLYCDRGLKMAFTAAELNGNNGYESLHMELTENNGPPGIIRAGGSGTITVYAKAPPTAPAHSYVHFILK